MAELLPLPSHPGDLAWAHEAWPTGDLDPRVDAGALHKLLDHAFVEPEPDDLERTHGIVIVQGGKVVAERYAEDVKPEDTFLSWSMAKSITSALVGTIMLVKPSPN